MPSGGLYNPYHLLREPETAIDQNTSVVKVTRGIFLKKSIPKKDFDGWAEPPTWITESKHIKDNKPMNDGIFQSLAPYKWKYTLPKFNIAPEKLPSQKESSLSTTIFQGLC